MASKRYIFNEFEADADRRVLFKNGTLVPLHSKAFDVLIALLENSDEVISKDELLDRVWTDQFVEESNLPVQISALRKVFGEKRNENRFIVTVAGKGYCFVAPTRMEEGLSDSRVASTNGVERTLSEAKARGRLRFFATKPFAAAMVATCVLAIAASALYLFRESGKAEAKSARLTRLTTSGKITAATVTPNGQYCVFAQAEEDGESLWLKQMASGVQSRILAPSKVEFIGLSVSPDNNFIYYSVFGGNRAGSFLKRLPLLGGPETEIGGIDTDVSVSFAPDGERFAFTGRSSSERSSYLKVADTDGKNLRIVSTAKDESRTFETYKSNPVAWSPNGGEIAAAITEYADGKGGAGIILVGQDGSAERVLVDPQFAFIENLAWLDADTLAFIGFEDDENASQIFTVDTRTLKIRKLTNDLHTYSWLGAANGLLLTLQLSSSSELKMFSTDTEFKAQNMLSESGKIWTSFGPNDTVFYTSAATGETEVWKAGSDGSGSTQVTVGARVTYGFTVSPVDGSIVFCSNRSGRHSLWLADAKGGSFRQLTELDDIAPQFSADGSLLVFQRGLNRGATVWGMRLGSGELFQISDQHSLKPSPSPDGLVVAYYIMDADDNGAWKIALTSVRDRAIKNKLAFPTAVSDRRMVWHPEKQIIGQAHYVGAEGSLLLIHPEGGTPTELRALGEGRINSFAWSHDGSKVVYSLVSERRDVVAVSGF